MNHLPLLAWSLPLKPCLVGKMDGNNSDINIYRIGNISSHFFTVTQIIMGCRNIAL